MSEVGLPVYPLRPNVKPLLLSMGISLAIHASLFGLAVILGVAATAFKDSSPKMLERLAELQPARQKPAAPPRSDDEIPLVFVEVDPAAATPEAPAKAKYYSSQNTKAANPDAQVETSVPKITGVQTHVPKTETVPLAKPMPLQPPAAKPAVPAEAETESKPKSGPKSGDLALLKPDTKPADQLTKTEPGKDAVEAHQRPRTLVEAKAQQSMMAGEMMKQDGGVTRRRVNSSLDTVGTPFGEYDEAIIRAIRMRWFDLLQERNFLRDHTGKVVLRFHLNYDGYITDMKVEENTVGDILGYICQRAITDPMPYPPWPNAMRQWFGADFRDVTFTFFYD